MSESNGYLWLEVSNVRTQGSEKEPPKKKNGTGTTGDQSNEGGTTENHPDVYVQVKGDRTDKEPVWWSVAGDAYGKDASETAREVFRALDSKRIVLAGMGILKNSKLGAVRIRIQFSDSGPR